MENKKEALRKLLDEQQSPDKIINILKDIIGIKQEDVPAWQEAIIECGDPSLIYGFAINIKGANIEACQDAIIKSGDARVIYKLALLHYKEVNVKACQDAIIKSGDSKTICDFALNVDGANIETCQDAVIKSGNAYDICYFAMRIKGANVEACLDAIIKSGDKQWINFATLNFPNVEETMDRINKKMIEKKKNANLNLSYNIRREVKKSNPIHYNCLDERDR